MNPIVPQRLAVSGLTGVCPLRGWCNRAASLKASCEAEGLLGGEGTVITLDVISDPISFSKLYLIRIRIK